VLLHVVKAAFRVNCAADKQVQLKRFDIALDGVPHLAGLFVFTYLFHTEPRSIGLEPSGIKILSATCGVEGRAIQRDSVALHARYASLKLI